MNCCGELLRATLGRRDLADRLRAGERRPNQPRGVVDRVDAILIGDENLLVPVGDAVGPVEAGGVTLNPFGAPVAVGVAHQHDVSAILHRDESVAIGQEGELARMIKLVCVEGGNEAVREDERAVVARDNKRRIPYRDPRDVWFLQAGL